MTYITQTIISEIIILQCQMIKRNKNRIKISSKNDLNVKSFSDTIDHLSLLLRLNAAELSRMICWNTSCVLSSVSLPNRCPSPMLKTKYSSSIFYCVSVSPSVMRAADYMGPGNWIDSVNTCKPLENIKSGFPILSVLLTCVLVSSQDLICTLVFHCDAKCDKCDICSVKQTQMHPEIDCKDRKIEKNSITAAKCAIVNVMGWMVVNISKYSKEERQGTRNTDVLLCALLKRISP